MSLGRSNVFTLENERDFIPAVGEVLDEQKAVGEQVDVALEALS